jgi:serine/threonine protein kinase
MSDTPSPSASVSGNSTGPSAETVLDHFESAWRRGERPDLEQFLRSYPGSRLDALVGLIHVELELRLKAGEAARVEEYLKRFPDLVEQRSVVVELLAAEHEQRGRREPALDVAEYLERFPPLASQLQSRLQAIASRPHRIGPGSDRAAGETPSSVWPLTVVEPVGPGGDLASGAGLDLRHYELLDPVGRGGMGEVYRGRDPALGRDLAVKVLRPELRGDPDAEGRFVQEARITSVLQHPNIVPVHNLGRLPDGRLYFTMKLVRGRTLAEQFARAESKPPLAEFLGIFEKVCQAVAFAHSRGIVHRDLKPANVMIGAFGEVQVMDWGLAKVLRRDTKTKPVAGETETVTDSVLRVCSTDATGRDRKTGIAGTPAYMPPEQARGDADVIDERADVFSLGAILCEFLTGRPPYSGDRVDNLLRSAAQGNTADAIARLSACGADAELAALCRDCLAPAPEDRPRDASLVAQRISAFQAGVQERLRQAELERAQAQVKAGEERKRRRLTVWLTSAVVALLALGVCGLWWLQQQKALNFARSMFDERLKQQDCSPEALQQAEIRLAELARLDRAEADRCRERWYQHVEDMVRSTISAERITVAEGERIAATLSELEKHRPELAAVLGKALAKRQTAWKTVASLAPPFEELTGVFPGELVRLAPDAPDVLVLHRPALAPGNGRTATRIGCEGDVRLSADWPAPWWGKVAELGLSVNDVQEQADKKQQTGPAEKSGPQPQRYTFLVGIPRDGPRGADAKVAKSALATLATAIREKGKLRLRILRNEQVLVSADVDVPPRFGEEKLRITATAEGGQLTLEVRGLPPLTFQDAFPLPPGMGVFSLSWSGEARLGRLQAESKSPSSEPGALERGDRLYVLGRWRDARNCYESLPDSQEAQFKAALCLLAENRLDDQAGERLKRVAVEEGKRWPALAEVYLWQLRLRQKRVDEANALLKELTSRYRFEDLVPLISQSMREEILDEHNRQRVVKFSFKPSDPDKVERLLEVQTLFGAPEQAIQTTRQQLVWALHEAERITEAIDHARKLLGQPISRNLRYSILWDYAWLCSRANDPATGLAEVERWRTHSEANQDSLAVYLLPHRAVLRARLREYDKAEADLNEYRRRIPPASQSPYAGLLYGFLREQRGDPDGARDAWRQAYRANMKRVIMRHDVTTVPLGSLANDISVRDTADMIDALITQSGPYFPAIKPLSAAVLTPAQLTPVLRAMWQSERGRRYARKLAFLEMPFAEWNSVPARLFAYELCNQLAVGGQPSGEQDELMWDLACRAHEAYVAGKLDATHLLQLGLAWKFPAAYAGPGLLKTRLDAPFRAAGCYLLGVRLLRKDPAFRASAIRAGNVVGSPSSNLLASIVTAGGAVRGMESKNRGQPSSVKEAIEFLNRAVKLAKEGSPVQRLAREELKRLQAR